MIKSNSRKAINNIKKYIVEHTTRDTDCVNEKLIDSVNMLNMGVNPETGNAINYFSVSGYRAISFFLVGNELYTPTEKTKYNIPDNALETIHISKNRTYFSFGARFERGL